jgi:ethanolamine utilization protein EutA
MIGLDFGSTTSSAMVATAAVGLNCTTGRIDLGPPRVTYRSTPVFTPFNGQNIDAGRLDGLIEQWLAESGVRLDELFAGGVIITGLAAKRENAAEVARLVGQRIGETVIATADDPCLESWLAFMGSCSVLSRFHAGTPFVNIDIGGGTTNTALGIDGHVRRTGCHFVGARHLQFDPGTYRLRGLSPYGRALLDDLGIRKDPGALLTAMELEAVLDFYVAALEAIATGEARFFEPPIGRLHQQVGFALEALGPSPPVLVFSGGVGELVYRKHRGEELPGTTHYGDLGIDLAERILRSPVLSAHVDDFVPENMGRATVYGLTLHSTEISGATIFLSSQDLLPLRDLPIVARLPIDADARQVARAIGLAEGGRNGICIQLVPRAAGSGARGPATGAAACEPLETVKRFAGLLHQTCSESDPRQPLVLLVSGNYGQALGNYATNWRQAPHRLVVIDEIPDRQAHFVNIGRMRDHIVPVSFYGVC